MRIICDTNVLISAIIYGGRPRNVLELLAAGRATGFTSPALTQEFREVISRPKFGLSHLQAHRICQTLGDMLQMVYPKESIMAVVDDPADNAVLACAIQAEVDYVISGDTHLLVLGNFRDIRILRPADFLAALNE